MPHPTLVLVSGLPASGKTTLAKAIADELSLPFLSKDETLKEPMFDAFATTSREWSIQIGKVSYQIMQNLIEQQLRAGYSMVVESTFKYEFDNPYFVELQQKYPFHAVQILCHAEPEVLAQRFIDRIENGERHPGHGHDYEDVAFDVLLTRMQTMEPPRAFALDGEVLEVDTTDFAVVDTAEILRKVADFSSTIKR